MCTDYRLGNVLIGLRRCAASAAALLLALTIVACGGTTPDPDDSSSSTRPQNTSPQNKGCTSDSDCNSRNFCDKSAASNSCSSSARGSCRPKVRICTEQYAPVCGCDGKTYSNACKAKASGVSVKHNGKCSTKQGCSSDSDCSKGEFCDKSSASNSCSSSSRGSCRPKSRHCTAHYAPVCGCDGKTYGNACQAKAAGVSVDHKGKCSSKRGCTSDSDCSSRQFCDKSSASNSCSKSARGSCRPKVRICTEEYAPVCGCDGKTYGNACKAKAAGVSVKHEGKCSARCGN